MAAYCNRCGEKRRDRADWKLSNIASEAFAEFTNLEHSKLWQTFRLLLFKPGQLTREDLERPAEKVSRAGETLSRLFCAFARALFHSLAHCDLRRARVHSCQSHRLALSAPGRTGEHTRDVSATDLPMRSIHAGRATSRCHK